MKFALLFLVICLALRLASAIGGRRGEPNRPRINIFGRKEKRSLTSGVKGGVKVHPIFEFPRSTTPSLRKGEYMCGDKVCKLKPGEVPKGCNGICQYRLL